MTRPNMNLKARLVRLSAKLDAAIELARGDQAIAHAARKGWLDPSKKLMRGDSAVFAADRVGSSLSDTGRLINAARNLKDWQGSLHPQRRVLAQRIRQSRRLFKQ